MAEATSRGSPGVLIAAATAGGIIGQQVAGKAVRDALFLSTFHATSLPLIMAASAVVSLLVVLRFSRIMATSSPHRILPLLFGGSGLALILEWALTFASPRAAAIVVYLHIVVFSPVVLSAFWSLINEQFDPHVAKTAVARIGSGGAFGGVLGGIAAWRASSIMSLPSTLIMLAGVSFACVAGTVAMTRDADAIRPAARLSSSPNAAEDAPPLTLLVRTPYLRNLALLVATGAASSSLLDYVFSAQVTAFYGKGPALLAFFSLFGVAVSALSLGLQLTLARIAIARLGLAVNIALLPAIIILGGTVGIAVPGLVSASALRGAEMVHRNTLFRSAYELLYTPLAEGSKRATKAIIDVGFDRLGSLAGSAIAILAVALTAHNQGALLGVVVILALASLPLARSLHSGYVAALEQRLRTAESVADVSMAAHARPTTFADERARDGVIERVEEAREHQQPHGRALDALAGPNDLVWRAAALLSGDAESARRALRGWDKRHVPLASFTFLLLAHPELYRDARDALRRVANNIVGQVVDVLLDERMDFIVRRRSPSVLAACRSQRAADALLVGIGDSRFEVRYACGRALARVVTSTSGLVFDRKAATTLLQRELTTAALESANAHEDEDDDDEPSTIVDVVARDRVSRSMETVFALLLLIVEPEALRLCFYALHTDDSRHRGTALEYLQTVLPVAVRDALLPLLSETGPMLAPRRAQDVLAELKSVLANSAEREEETARNLGPAAPSTTDPGTTIPGT